MERRLTVTEGLYSGLSRGHSLAQTQQDAKIQLLVEAPAAVEDALASLLDDQDTQLQVGDIHMHMKLDASLCGVAAILASLQRSWANVQRSWHGRWLYDSISF